MTGILAGVAWALLGSKLLVVRSVVVTGTHLVPAAEVIAAAGVQPGTPLIRVNTGQVAARVEGITQVRAAVVTKSWPDRLVIAVRERTPAVAVRVPGGFDLVDPAGVVVRSSQTRPAGLPLYLSAAAPAQMRGDPDLAAAAAVLGELPGGLRGSVNSVTAPAPDQVTLRLAGRVTVLWGGTDHAAVKAKELAILMKTHAHYYDVSAQGTVVTR
jgi:cell division protein FtsQ